MKILLISGSPRAHGNTESLLNHAANFLEQQDCRVCKFYSSQSVVNHCHGCDSCEEQGYCSTDDDMNLLYDYYEECDGLIIGSPVYYRNVSGQLKTVFDRSYAVRKKNPLLNKVGGALAIGRGTGGGQALALTMIHNFFLSSGVICVPGELNGVTAVADKPGDILSQNKRLKQIEILCQNIMKWIIKK